MNPCTPGLLAARRSPTAPSGRIDIRRRDDGQMVGGFGRRVQKFELIR